MATPFLVRLLFLLALLTRTQSVDFVYNGFNDTNLIRDGAATIIPNGALRLTNRSNHVMGHAFHPEPIHFFNSSNNSVPVRNASSFSVYFVFAIVSSDGENRGGYGFAFTLSPNTYFLGAQGDHFLGIFNTTNDGLPSNHILAIEFDTVNGINEASDAKGNHVGVNINGIIRSNVVEMASYIPENTKEDMNLESGERIQAWIDYDGLNKLLNVTIAPWLARKPTTPLIRYSYDLSPVFKETMFAGFSSATGKKASSHFILGWSFKLNGRARPLDIFRLPTAPNEVKSSPYSPQIKAFIAALSVVVFLLIAVLSTVIIYRKRMEIETLEDWERDCPHRFRYKDLSKATKGFKDSELLGAGGFGVVYKGVLPSTKAVVAVKRISNNSLQGMREFAAEIESLGRLRHKNLVNLQGWCKRNNELLLVYDFIPNGSLDFLLYNSSNTGLVLSWEQRFNIIKGIASGLLYLHEEWEKVVIHRDVKSSNVLIDADMNGRLGDFGLARLYEHGKNSHTTSVVGTIGYIAPELTKTGKASTRSDVFAYGVLLLEIGCGKGAVLYDSGQGSVLLTDWVMENFQTGRILEVVDPKLRSNYEIEEIELVLGLGLLCSHPEPESRPTMRLVNRYLNGDEPLPIFDKLCEAVSGRSDENNNGFRIFQVISAGAIATSYRSSSIGEMSSSSLDAGR